MSRRPLLACILLCATACAAPRPRPSAPAQPENLLTSTSVVQHAGSLAGADLVPFLNGEGALRRVRIPPHDLDVQWAQPVTVDTLYVQWESQAVHARHYGLEFWDAPSESFKLAFEETANRQAERTHHFKKIRTKRVRFTVFDHPVHYNSVVLNALSLRLHAAEAQP